MSRPGFSGVDHRHMGEALRLARRGLYTTDPNPRVGCVVVQGDTVVGRGYHERAGGPHAEVAALAEAGAASRGATVYVTLEPCCHHGRTPPCTDALAEAGVARVVAAMADPNPAVSGQGLARLEASGISVAAGLMEQQAAALNPGFVSRMQRGRPWLRVKLAASLDGYTALPGGDSRWITGPAARADGHRFRARASAILTGSGTVLADDPRLTARPDDAPAIRQPRRIVLDSSLRTPPDARLFDSPEPVTVVTTANAEPSRASALTAAGARVERFAATADGHVDIGACLRWLAAEEINELHVEAGATLAGVLLHQQWVDELVLYTAPRILGQGRGLFTLPALKAVSEGPAWTVTDWRRIGEDFRVVARPAPSGAGG